MAFTYVQTSWVRREKLNLGYNDISFSTTEHNKKLIFYVVLSFQNASQGLKCTEESCSDSWLLPIFRYTWDNSRALLHKSLQRKTDKTWVIFKTSVLVHRPQDCRGVSLSIPWDIHFPLNHKWSRKYVMIIFLLGLKITCTSAVSCVFNASIQNFWHIQSFRLKALFPCAALKLTFSPRSYLRQDATHVWDWF